MTYINATCVWYVYCWIVNQFYRDRSLYNCSFKIFHLQNVFFLTFSADGVQLIASRVVLSFFIVWTIIDFTCTDCFIPKASGTFQYDDNETWLHVNSSCTLLYPPFHPTIFVPICSSYTNTSPSFKPLSQDVNQRNASYCKQE